MDVVFVIYCYVANWPHIQLCKTTIYYLWEFLWDRNFGQDTTGTMYSVISETSARKLEGWELESPIHFYIWWEMLILTGTSSGAVGQNTYTGLSMWLLGFLTAIVDGLREREGERVSGGSCIAFSNLISQVTLCPFYHILFIGIKSLRSQNCQTCFNIPWVWTIAQNHWLKL